MASNRISIIFGLLITVLFQCKSEKTEKTSSDIKLYNWGTPENTIIEKGFYHSKNLLDTMRNQLEGDTLIPIEIEGSQLIIKKLEPLQMEWKVKDDIEDFYITKIGYKTDTFLYDIKQYFGKHFLILISNSSMSQAYELKETDVKMVETQNIIFPVYKVEGYAVGDEINRSDIEVLSKDQFGSLTTEEAILKKNNNIIFKIKAELYIEEIHWTNINYSEVEGIAKQLNHVFSKEPDIEYHLEGDNKNTEVISHYYWSENDVNILLSRATEFGYLDDVWSLRYTNLIVSNILNNYVDDLSENL